MQIEEVDFITVKYWLERVSCIEDGLMVSDGMKQVK